MEMPMALRIGRLIVALIGGAIAAYFGLVASLSLLYLGGISLLVGAGIGSAALVSLVGAVGTLQRRAWGAVLVAVGSGALLAFYLATGYPEPGLPILLGLASALAITYALASRWSSAAPRYTS
jgi:hypothetical protein